MDTTIWHNPRCTKSRQALALLREHGIEPKVYLYLDTPPSLSDLKKVLKTLGITAQDLARKGEDAYKDGGLKDADDAGVLKAMVAEPRLIERPIVITEKGAVIGRPTEKILEII